MSSVEQAQMENVYNEYKSSVSFGHCEGCGIVSDLFFRESKFLCNQCAGVDKPRAKPRFRIFGK